MSTTASRLAGIVQAYQSEHRQDFVDLLFSLVAAESPSLNPEAQRPVLELLQERFEQLGLVTRRTYGPRSGGHLLARTPAKRRPFQLMLGHCDTVWPLDTLKTMPLVEKDGWIYGPGVYDMKAGLAMMVFALQTVRALGMEPELAPVVLVNSDEEVGSFEVGSFGQFVG